MENFEYWAKTKFYFGKGAEKNIGTYLKEYGAHKVMMLYYGTKAPHEESLIASVRSSLEQANLTYVEFSGIEPNPTYETAQRGTAIALRENVDFLLALGGASVIDTAKYISIASCCEEDAFDYYFLSNHPIKKVLPVATISTVSGAGSDGSNSCVITKGHLKRSCNQDALRPAIAVLNPELTYSVPKFLTASGAVDIIAHVHERYFVYSGEHYLTDNMCEAVMRSVIKYLPIALEHPHHYEARAQLMWASIVAHNDIVGVGRSSDRYGLAHAIQSEIGGRYNSIHGAGCALATLGMMKYLYRRDIPRFTRYFHEVWGIPIDPMDPEAMIRCGIDVQENFYIQCGIPVHYADYGVKKEDIPALAASVRKGPDGFIGGSMKLTEDDIIAIFNLME